MEIQEIFKQKCNQKTGMEKETAKKAVVPTSQKGRGLILARQYYEEYGIPMIKEQFPEYEHKIAAGLSGKGSDCFGYDDETSQDHDWGPDFCLWVTRETYEKIGEKLETAYRQLPTEFQGYGRAKHISKNNKRGVLVIPEFFKALTGAECYEQINWAAVQDSSLAAAVNGEIFQDQEGCLTAFRNKLLSGYPEEIRYRKMEESAARFSRAAQYNFPRMWKRGDTFTAKLLLWNGILEAMKLQHYIENRYPLQDKWLRRSLEETEAGRSLSQLLLQLERAEGLSQEAEKEAAMLESVEKIGNFLTKEMQKPLA